MAQLRNRKTNIFPNSFQAAIKAYGVSDVDVFQTVDLWEKKDIAQVTNTIFALGREVRPSPLLTVTNRTTSFLPLDIQTPRMEGTLPWT